MASNSHRKSSSSARSKSRKKVYIPPGPPRREREGLSQQGVSTGRAPGDGSGKWQRPSGRAGHTLSKTKRTERDIRLAAIRRQRRVRAAFVAIAVIAVVGGFSALYRSSAFPVRRIEVVGNRRLTAEQVRSLARVPADATLLRFPARAVRERLLADSWIASVRVTRDFPDGMRVRLEERSPIARLDVKSTFWLVDTNAFVLGHAAVEDTSTLPLVRDIPGLSPKAGRRVDSPELKNALRVLAGLSPSLRSSTRAISAPSIDRTAIYTSDGVEIFFGESSDLSRKDLVARRIMKEQKGKVVSINVRTVERPTWHGLEE